MSWLFSQALVEAYSEAICLGGEPSAPSNGSHTPQAYLSSDKMTGFSRLSRFGMTFKPLTESRGKKLLTLYLAGFHAKTSVLLGKEQALTENARECGHTWRESLAKFDPVSSSWRTVQLSLLEDLGESSVIWPRSGMTVNGQCWELPTLEHRINGIDSGLWPTPTVCGNYNRKGASKTSGDGLATAVFKCATPTARDWKSGKASQATMEKNSRPLSEQIGGSLNPPWVEWLMGWPEGWTDLKPLETVKFQQWQQQHGGC